MIHERETMIEKSMRVSLNIRFPPAGPHSLENIWLQRFPLNTIADSRTGERGSVCLMGRWATSEEPWDLRARRDHHQGLDTRGRCLASDWSMRLNSACWLVNRLSVSRDVLWWRNTEQGKSQERPGRGGRERPWHVQPVQCPGQQHPRHQWSHMERGVPGAGQPGILWVINTLKSKSQQFGRTFEKINK